jgi:hypothetical protein
MLTECHSFTLYISHPTPSFREPLSPFEQASPLSSLIIISSGRATMQFTNLFALVAASSLSTGFLSVLAAPAPNIHGSVVDINVLGSQDHLDHASPPVRTTQNGRLEAHWAFFVHAGKEIDYLYVDFYNGDSASPSTLSRLLCAPQSSRKASITNMPCPTHQPAATPGQSHSSHYKANSTAVVLPAPTAPPPALPPTSSSTQTVPEPRSRRTVQRTESTADGLQVPITRKFRKDLHSRTTTTSTVRGEAYLRY